MPSSSKTQSSRQSQAGHTPLSQSPQNTAIDHTIARHGRKKGRSAAPKISGASKAEDNTWDETLSESPPQPAQQTQDLLDDDDPDIDRQHVDDDDVLGALENLDGASDVEETHQTEKWNRPLQMGSSPMAASPVNKPAIESPAGLQDNKYGGFSSRTPPVSPPQRKARPVSFGGSSNVSRRPSAEKNYRHGLAASPFIQPPLPHLPQAHFYGAPDINLGLGDWPNTWMPERTVHFMSFDRMSTTGCTKWPDPCLLVGSTGRLDILSISGDKFTPVGCVIDLPGDVIGAKLLSDQIGQELYDLSPPFIAVTIHGPRAEEDRGDELHQDQTTRANPSQTQFTAPSGHPEYQTWVDVFSLVTYKRISTLLIGQPTSTLPALRGLPSSPPPPSRDISIHVNGRYILVSSGSSGEIFVFVASNGSLICLTKLWTTIQSQERRKYSSSSASTESDVSPTDPSRGQTNVPLPLLSWNGRWLAIVPPSSSTRSSFNGVVPPNLVQYQIPELGMVVSPPRPPTNCLIDSPDAESIFNKFARGFAKEVVKGARWLGDQSLQTWNSYWNRDASPPSTSSPNGRLPPSQESFYPPGTFPPTHGNETNTPSTDPEVISIFDLHDLEHQDRRRKTVMAPVATFQPPGGCSFLSFSPIGLLMLTASKTGDVQYLWDLMQVSHTRVAALVSNNPASVDGDVQHQSPRVRQVARYARLTSSRTVEVVWTGPVGDRFAMLTRNGTVHVFDVPQSAFQWPPPRRIQREPPSPALSPSTTSEPDAGSGVFASAMRFAGKTQPILANLRGRTTSIGGTLGGMSTTGMGFASATGVRSGKAVAAGLSKSVGAATETVSHLRHAGENRIHLHALARHPRPGTVAWSVVRGDVVILALDGSIVRTYKTKRREVTVKQTQKVRVSVIDTRHSVEARIPPIEQLSKAAPSDYHFGSKESDRPKQESVLHDGHPLSRAEIETNAPFQPFHSDNRVNLFVYTSQATSEASSENRTSTRKKIEKTNNPRQSTEEVLTPWIFGDKIPTKKLTLRLPNNDVEGSNILPADHGSTLVRQAQAATRGDPGVADGNPIEQIVITTRRKKNRPQGDATASAEAAIPTSGDPFDTIAEDDGFFEDDCEVLDWAGDRV